MHKSSKNLHVLNSDFKSARGAYYAEYGICTYAILYLLLLFVTCSGKKVIKDD